ncbi:MAG: lipase maturation factor family protein [Myxococcota bacterium]
MAEEPQAPQAPLSDRHFALAAWIYGRGLGVVFAVAFLSYAVQLRALFGREGLAPAGAFLERVDAAPHLGFWDFPGIGWVFHRLGGLDDAGLIAICVLGGIGALMLIVGALPRIGVLLAWAAYLSLVNTGFPFTAFQWDTLLLEVGLASVFVLPFRGRRDLSFEPPALARFVIAFLLFRLMFRSGLVKLQSSDEYWTGLRALEVHYETQPLPTLLGYVAHQLPDAVHGISCLLMFVIELGVPFLLFVPRRFARVSAAACFCLLMVLIALTGNYTFFNLLTILLTVLLLDDAILGSALGRFRPRLRFPTHREPVSFRANGWVPLVGPGAFLVLGLITLFSPASSEAPLHAIGGFRSFNNYGLFQVMTRTRPEIVIEGSHDGQHWVEYEFPFKPGRIDRPPRFNTPHQPRLDWQMWFAALRGDYRQTPWLTAFLQKLLENDPVALSLLETNPFPDEPPRYIRATLYTYSFTDFGEWQESGAYWQRVDPRPYTPVLAR